jgi:hypothetical protein
MRICGIVRPGEVVRH